MSILLDSASRAGSSSENVSAKVLVIVHIHSCTNLVCPILDYAAGIWGCIINMPDNRLTKQTFYWGCCNNYL